jgi:hypothetical protein
MMSIGGMFFGLVFTGIGGFAFQAVKKIKAKAQVTLTWPTADGAVVHADVHTSHHDDSKGHSRTTYTPEVIYNYIVNGVQYSGKSIAVCGVSKGPGFAKAVVAKYPEFSKVTVHYNPANPADAVLEPGNIEGLNALYVVGGVFGGFGVLMILMSLMR